MNEETMIRERNILYLETARAIEEEKVLNAVLSAVRKNILGLNLTIVGLRSGDPERIRQEREWLGFTMATTVLYPFGVAILALENKIRNRRR